MRHLDLSQAHGQYFITLFMDGKFVMRAAVPNVQAFKHAYDTAQDYASRQYCLSNWLDDVIHSNIAA